MKPELIVQTSCLLSLSDEVLLNIVDYIETPRHLASLALACKQLNRIISPTDAQGLGPLKCRQLSVSMDDEEVLSKLATPALANCVRKLRLRGGLDVQNLPRWRYVNGLRHFDNELRKKTREDQEPFWTFLSSHNRPNVLAALLNTTLCRLANMRVLIVDDMLLMPKCALFLGLQSACLQLTKVILRLCEEQPFLAQTGGGLGESGPGQRGVDADFQLAFSGIEHVSTLDIVVSWDSRNVIADRIADLMLNSYEELRFLSLLIPYLPTSGFDMLRFPLLRSFSLSFLGGGLDMTFVNGLYVNVAPQVSPWLATFLLNHETIEDLRIRTVTSWIIPNRALPNLRRLFELPPDPSHVLSSPPGGTFRPLRWLGLNVTSSGIPAGLVNILPTLVVLDLSCELAVVPQTVRSLPSLPTLETLAISLPRSIGSIDLSKVHKERLDFLGSKFPNMRCLKGFFTEARLYVLFDWEILPDSAGAMKRAVRRLGKACPKLRIVDCWRRSEDSSSWELDSNEDPGLVWPPFDEEWEHSYNWSHREG